MTHPTMPNPYPLGSPNHSAPRPASDSLLEELRDAGVRYDTSPDDRANHGRDWWPLTIPDVASGRVPQWPSAVVYPISTQEVSRVAQIATKHSVPLTAQGGRSGVLGGAAAPTGALALDLTGLDRVIGIDSISGTVSVEAGVFGPDLESIVNEHGWTVGHFPQSFNLSTVGGWIACRGAGQYSNRYGKIEDIVRSLTVVTANGDVIDVGDSGPRRAVGPDLTQLFVGSEGTLGIITRATLVMHPIARTERRSAFLFDSFDVGMDACRRIMQSDAHPAVLRLYDQNESKRNFDLEGCALIALDEGDQLLVSATMEIVQRECQSARTLESSYVATWLSHRNRVDALVPLWESGLVVDTIEVAGSWSTLPAMRERVIASLKDLNGIVMVSVHQSHAYLDGACLYFTFVGRRDDTKELYREAWDVVTAKVLEGGGALSHHHGIGRNRARFVERALGTAFPLLDALKKELDPHSIMNPGVLGIGGKPW